MKLQEIPVTDAQIKEMLAVAKKARNNTYPEPGKYAMAVLTKAGNIYPGVSYRSDTYTALSPSSR